MDLARVHVLRKVGAEVDARGELEPLAVLGQGDRRAHNLEALEVDGQDGRELGKAHIALGVLLAVPLSLVLLFPRQQLTQQKALK
jgi:hypothetical protein